jgi:hypothetical protein
VNDLSHVLKADLQQSLAVLRLSPETGQDPAGMIAKIPEVKQRVAALRRAKHVFGPQRSRPWKM